jgi:hypothetical protein
MLTLRAANLNPPVVVVRFMTSMESMISRLSVLRAPTFSVVLALALALAGSAAGCKQAAGEDGDSTRSGNGSLESGRGLPGSTASGASRAHGDTTLAAAERAIAEGRPWRATELLTAALRDSSRRSPAAILLAANAAAGWGGWSEVERLLAGEPWLDSERGGEGRVLLVNAALARSADSVAADHAARSLASARNDRERGTRLVLLARALDRMEQRDSSAATYARAAALLPEAEDWLRLRAAAIMADSVERARQLSQVRIEAARARVGLTDALARERTGDVAGAINAYTAIGSRVAALRLRTVIAVDSAERRAIRAELFSLASSSAGTANAHTAVEILDASYTPFTPAEELAIARAIRSGGSAARVVTAYSRALGAGLGTSNDRYQYALALVRAGRGRDALPQFARVTEPSGLGGGGGWWGGGESIKINQHFRQVFTFVCRF